MASIVWLWAFAERNLPCVRALTSARPRLVLSAAPQLIFTGITMTEQATTAPSGAVASSAFRPMFFTWMTLLMAQPC
jgi:hypothetical protein